MDQSIAGFAPAAAPRRFRRDWALTVVWPGLGCSAVAVAMIGDDLRLEDAGIIFLLGMPAIFWFAVGLLQARLLGGLIERPLGWALATGAGGSFALIGGFAVFAALTVLVDVISGAGYDFAHPLALIPFGLGGAIAGAILGFFQTLSLRVPGRARRMWLGGSTVAGALAFFLLCAGVNAMALVSGQGLFDLAPRLFFAAAAALLLAGALLHNFLMGLGLQRLLAWAIYLGPRFPRI